MEAPPPHWKPPLFLVEASWAQATDHLSSFQNFVFPIQRSPSVCFQALLAMTLSDTPIGPSLETFICPIGAYFRYIESFLSSSLETEHIGPSERFPWPRYKPLEITKLYLVPHGSLLLPWLELSIGQVLVGDSPWGTITLVWLS